MKPIRKRRSIAQARAEAEAAVSGQPIAPVAAKARRKRRRHIEDDHQAAYFGWVDQMAKQDPRYALILAIPNGGTRDPREAARMKGQGTRPGVPDILVAAPALVLDSLPLRDRVTKALGLFLELKRPIVKGEPKPRVSPEQADWLTRLQAVGYVCCVCYGWDQARESTAAYLADLPEVVPHQWSPLP